MGMETPPPPTNSAVYKLNMGSFLLKSTKAVLQVIVVAWFVRVYAAIMHERQRVHYHAYTCTNHATTHLSHLYASDVYKCQGIWPCILGNRATV